MIHDGVRRDAAVISALTMVSRITGFARIVVTAAVLGTGVLGDVYQSANTVPNILFELLAGGVLQAALVPLFVAARSRSGEGGLTRTVGVVGGTVTAVLAAMAVVLACLAPLVARALMVAEPDEGVAADKVRLATWMLVVFAPQIVFYGIGVVTSAALQAQGRFVAAALAPAVNNLVVIACYLAFDAMRGDAPPSLELTAAELVVLAGGTTFAVLAFTAVPLLALTRSTSEAFEVRVDLGHEAVRQVRAVGSWAVVQVAGVLGLSTAALVIGNGAPGGVAVFALAMAVFLLPFSLVAGPVATATLPRLSALDQAGDAVAFRELVVDSLRRVIALSAVAAVGLAVFAWPIARFVVVGAAEDRGPAPVAHALLAFAPGVVPYGAWFVLSRALIARGEVRSAAMVSLATFAVGVLAMVLLAGSFVPSDRAAALAAGYSVAHVVGVVLAAGPALRRRVVGAGAHT